jgi:hypothetical protein
MESFPEAMNEYRQQLEKGSIQIAYKGLMEYVMALRTHFQKKYPHYVVPGNIYTGYMDMTYFAIFPPTLKERGLKIAVVFIHETCRFEVWLAAVNKQVQEKYWKLIKATGWDKFTLVSSLKGEDAIITSTLAADPDFRDLDALTGQIERGTLKFIGEVEKFLSKSA